MIKTIYNYRGLIIGSVLREFEAKYKNSLLGASWTIIQPLSMIIVYTIIFSQIMQAKLPGIDNKFSYSIYICSGILTWSFFSEICSRHLNIFIDNANLIKKINFPKICLPIIAIINSLLNFSIIFSIFIAFLLATGSFPTNAFLAIIPVTAIMMFLAVGIGIIIGVLNVFFRDVGQLFNIVIQFWFWLTPIIYPSSILPENFRRLMNFNPMQPIISSYQDIFVYQKNPDWVNLIYPAIFGFLSCMIGFIIYRQHHGEMVDEL